MSLVKQFDDELKGAMKASDSVKVSVLRMIKAAVKNKQIEKGGELGDDEVVSVLSSMVKQRRESIEQFSKAGRMDLVEREEQERVILQSYMPRQLSHEEIDGCIRDAIKASSAQGVKDIGAVMRLIMPKLKGVADGAYVNQRVKELLTSGA